MIYLILEGLVKIRTHNIEGKEVTLNIVDTGELIREIAALEELSRSTGTVPLTPTTFSSIPAQKFISLFYSNPVIGIRLAQVMARRIRRLNQQLRLRSADSQVKSIVGS